MAKISPKSTLKTVELFCGIGGFRIAADAENLQTIWANDLCPKAVQVYQDRFGNRELAAGDIRDLWMNIPEHDILTAGFPCQPFSSAGKKKGLRDPRGHLFEIIIKVLKQIRPRFFILENVKRILSMESGTHFAAILNQLTHLNYQVEWRLLNTSDFGLPQNRERVILIGEARDQITEGKSHPKICLASESDLSELDESFYYTLNQPKDWNSLDKHGNKFPCWGLAMNNQFVGYNLQNFSESAPLIPLSTILEAEVDAQFDFTQNTLERLENSSLINRFVKGVHILYNQSGGSRMGYTVFGTDGLAPTLTSTASRHYERYKIGEQYRRLTHVEYARLQGFPDAHCSAISVYDQYSLYGNAVPPPMIKWVLQKMFRTPPQCLKQPKYHQLALPL